MSDQPENSEDFTGERALLVTLQPSNLEESRARAHLEELRNLVATMGIVDTLEMVVKHREPHPKFLIGTGKADEISQLAKDEGVTLIIFDDDLSPSQQRNWEELTGKTVIDRQEVILEIFAQRARTREAVLQVGLARMEYSLPRLARSYTHMSRQRGGAKGTRGAGETQLELDRRTILQKIDLFKEELEKVRRHREVNRKKRTDNNLPSASIVGYTNAGKSSLLNKLAGADILAEDKLFATLDPTTRRVPLDKGLEILLTDTVGFIQKLPHNLVDAFRSTLEEAGLADILIHLVDGADPEFAQHIKTTNTVLKELQADGKPTLLVFNKVDKLEADPVTRRFLEVNYPEALLISTYTGEGLENLRLKLIETLTRTHGRLRYLFPMTRGDLVAFLHKNGQVLEENYLDDSIEVIALVEEAVRGQLKAFEAQA